MSKNRLYVIGNGFDIYHGVNSRYSDFRDFVEKHDIDLYKSLEEYFDYGELWSDFEETLANIDIDRITEDASTYLVSYAAEDWSEASHHDYQYEIDRAINLVTVTLKVLFTKWILQLEIPNSVKLNLSPESKYLTFNYTQTLESVYGILNTNIVYIHNKAENEDSTLILGHSREPTPENLLYNTDDMEDMDVRVAEGNQILDNYFAETYKNTDILIIEKQLFFENLNIIDEVFVLGHSLSPVDIKYFKKIAENVSANTIWFVSYYDDAQIAERLRILSDLGIQNDKVRLIKLDDLALL